MNGNVEKTTEEALAYMRNLPKIYVKELKLNRDIFLGIMGCICEIAKEAKEREEKNDAPKYMSLTYDAVQKYCSRSQGFPIKYVCGRYSQYHRTIDATILIYYKLMRTDGHEFDDAEREKMFGKHFLSEQELDALQEASVIARFKLYNPDKIEKEKQDGHWGKSLEENWRKKYSLLLNNQIENSQIIRDNFFLEEEFNELADEGAALKRVINFLDKLEKECHERRADNVLIPYKEYHALHEMLSERPWEKAVLQEKHAKIVRKLERVFGLQAKKQG